VNFPRFTESEITENVADRFVSYGEVQLRFLRVFVLFCFVIFVSRICRAAAVGQMRTSLWVGHPDMLVAISSSHPLYRPLAFMQI
jgi:hypothetical protein